MESNPFILHMKSPYPELEGPPRAPEQAPGGARIEPGCFFWPLAIPSQLGEKGRGVMGGVRYVCGASAAKGGLQLCLALAQRLGAARPPPPLQAISLTPT